MSNDDSSRDRIVDAAMALLARSGLDGVSMRGVAREAGVAVGLANYHFGGKRDLVAAALERVGEMDLDLVRPETAGEAVDRLRRCLARALDPGVLTGDYLSLRMQLWALAAVDPAFARINAAAQRRYVAGLADLIEPARPELGRGEVERRAVDILIEQNGVWLTAILVTDEHAVARALDRCLAVALE